MSAARVSAVLFAALAFAAPANAAVDAPKLSPPEGMRAFLLKADEPQQPEDKRAFPRTPSFAWKPVPRALRYEFQLSTSDAFRENGMVYTNREVKTPALAVPISLPWISGKPYSLFARLRAVTQVGTTPWTEPYGFNMRPSSEGLEPMTTFPGLLRWTPVTGATSYQVWLVDVKTPGWPNGKLISTTTNVVDERESYTFHQATKWTSTLRWRIRAMRVLYGSRANSLPAVSTSTWSKTYTAVNPPFAVGPLGPTATASDQVMDGTATESALPHGLMPGFVFSGNEVVSDNPDPVELYRVYVSTDDNCVNIVFRGSVVGSPAFAPRTSGVLKLPTSLSATKTVKYLDDGETSGAGERSNDGIEIVPNEAEKPESKTSGSGESSGEGDSSGSGEGESSGSGASSGSGEGSGSSSGSGEGSSSTGGTGKGTTESEKQSEKGSTTGGKATAEPVLPDAETTPIPPVDLWDTYWEKGGGYYWTVVGVRATQPDPIETSLTLGAAIGDTKITVADAGGLLAGYTLEVGPTPPEVVTIKAIAGNTITLEKALVGSHFVADEVKLSSDSVFYQDVELPQDACEAGRVYRFGKKSEPAVAVLGAPLVSGLSIKGKLVSASRTEALFYGPPVVAWNPAWGAQAYEVQWSKKTGDDFERAAAPILTWSTSAVLPLTPGTWYYRVRGLNLAMPKGSQTMAWSNEVKVMIAKPRFTIVKK